MTGNDFVKFFLRTPLRVFMGNTMLITVTGCKTGKKYSTPVNFYIDGDCLWVISSRDRTWWRNVKNGAEVSLSLNGKTMNAFAKAELDDDSVRRHLQDYVQHIPLSAKAMGIRVENGQANAEDIARTAKDRLFVRLELKPEPA